MKPLLFACLALGFARPNSLLIHTQSAIAIKDTVPASGFLNIPAGVDTNSRDYRIVFVKMEVDPAFKGGETAWNKMVDSTLNANADLLHSDGEQSTGICKIMLIINRDGSLRKVYAENMQGSRLAAIAVQMIVDHPDSWIPATQNGYKVNAFHRVTVSYGSK